MRKPSDFCRSVFLLKYGPYVSISASDALVQKEPISYIQNSANN